MLRDAARRFGLLLGGTAGGTAVFALLIGLALGAGVSRSISIGFYLVGSFLLILGFFAGNRGPVRVKRPRRHHIRLWYALADLYERAGDTPRARELFGRIVAAEPDFADAAERLAALD